MIKRDLDTPTFHYLNINPLERKTSDCVIRAISVAMKTDYNQVLLDLVEIQMETGYSINDVKCYGKYLKRRGWIRHSQPKKSNGHKYTGSEFCIRLTEIARIEPCGSTKYDSIIAHIGSHHIVCITHNNCYNEENNYRVCDTWDSTRNCIGIYWTLENN